MFYVAPDYLEVPATGKTLLCVKAPDFRRKEICHCYFITIPLLKTRLKYSNNLNHKSNRALVK